MSHPLMIGILLLLPIGLLINMLLFDRIRRYRQAGLLSAIALVLCLLAEGMLIVV